MSSAISKEDPRRAIQRERVKEGIWRRTGGDGRPRYEITYRDSGGRQRRQVIDGGMRTAEATLGDVKARIGRGERVAPRRHLTFGEAAAAWMNAQGATLRPATRDAYRSMLDTHLLPAWGKVRLDRIDVDAVAALVERMQTAEYRAEVRQRLAASRQQATGREPTKRAKAKKKRPASGYRSWTIRGVLTPAGRVFDFARRRMDWAGTNPVRDLDRSERPQIGQRERRILSHEELGRVLGVATEPYKTILITAAGLGTRLGETLGLAWGDLDLEAGTVSVRYQIDRHRGRVELKTVRSRRVIEMPGSVVAALRAHRLRTDSTAPQDLVFTSRTGGPMEHRNVAQRGLERAYQRAKLKGRPPTFHELRHAHASAWIASGGDLVELSSRLGHRDPSVTASVYSHEFEAAARSADRRARLDALYGPDRGSIVAAPEVREGSERDPADKAEVGDLQGQRDARQQAAAA
jgi:integrase